MIAESARCNDERLTLLLEGAEGSAEFENAAKHLEGCARCQQRLTELSGDDGFWSSQRALLAPLEGDDPRSGEFHRHRIGDSTHSHRPTVDEASIREMLAAPSHPEMLGRLGRYEIERIIGAGGMGIVLKGFDSELNRPVAIKLLAPHLARVGAARQRFAREAKAAAAVAHEHVVAIHNVESESSTPFLVMQFIPGESLQARVEREGPLSVAEILRIGVQAAAGLAAAHAQGLVHRDVKPANILLENGVERAYLTDFGLARASDDASLTYTGIVAGTPHYMSPEQADGQPLDFRSDLFSLGSVLYFMSTGHPPFRADRAMAVLKRTCHDTHRPAWHSNAEIPDALSKIIDRLLEKKPSARFGSAQELLAAIQAVLADLQQGRLRPRRRWGSKRWGLWTAIACATIATGIAAGMFFSFPQKEKATLKSSAPVGELDSRESPLEALKKLDPSSPEEFQTELHELSGQLDSLERALPREEE
jgi:serine/threonine protein kinase